MKAVEKTESNRLKNFWGTTIKTPGGGLSPYLNFIGFYLSYPIKDNNGRTIAMRRLEATEDIY